MNVAVFSLSSYEDVQKVFNETKAGLGEILSAFEFFDKQAYDLVKRHMKEGGEAERKVFETEGEFYVLVETGGSNNDADMMAPALIIGLRGRRRASTLISLNASPDGSTPILGSAATAPRRLSTIA